MNTGVWANIERLVKSPKCVACGEDTNFGGKGKYDLCKKTQQLANLYITEVQTMKVRFYYRQHWSATV